MWVHPLSTINLLYVGVLVIVFSLVIEERVSGVTAFEVIKDLIKLLWFGELIRFLFIRMAVMSPCTHFGFVRDRNDRC